MGGIRPQLKKLACSPMFSPLFSTQNVNIVSFMQFLVIMPKLSPLLVDHIWETLENQHCYPNRYPSREV